MEVISPTWENIPARWESRYRLLERYAGEHGRPPPNAARYGGFQLGKWCSAQRAAFRRGTLSADKKTLLERIRGWDWSPGDKLWFRRYRVLESYAQDHGHPPPKGVNPESNDLGKWCTYQRSAYRCGRLSAEKAALLERIPGWIWEPRSSGWLRRYRLLEKYTREHGHLPTHGVSFEGVWLGTWCSWQRATRRRGKLSPERAALLEKLPAWDWDPNASRWAEMCGLLMEYSTEHEGKSPPPDLVYKGRGLGEWYSRQCFRLSRGSLPEEQAAALERVPGWSIRTAATRWAAFYGLLREYSARFGGAPQPGVRFKGEELGDWCAVQRLRRIGGRLESDRAECLERVPGWAWE